MKERLTPKERELVSRLAEKSSPTQMLISKDTLLADKNYDIFFRFYFPDAFPSFEPLNYAFIDFLEDERKGVAWLPGQHGKSTTLLHWMIYVMCREPQVSIVYIEKSLPVAERRATAVMDILEHNPRLSRDFGDFKGSQWSAKAFVIKQRPNLSQWPTLAVFGPGGTSALGNRTNILLVDDPITQDNSGSELERNRLLDWWNMAAATCSYPLPISNERYLNKLFLVGTTFHQDDLFHRVIQNKQFKHLHLRAVDEATGETLSPRFSYRDPKVLAESEDEADKKLARDIKVGKVTDLWAFRYGTDGGTKAFYARYQNEIIGQAQKFSPAWFEPGGKDDYAPPGGYVGCKDFTLGLGEYREGMKCVTGIDPAASTKSTGNARFACVTLGFMPDDPTTYYLVDLDYGQAIPLDSDNESKRTQVGIALDHAQAYHSRICLETNNIQGAYAGVLRKNAKERGIVVQITGHYSSLGKKIDPILGIEAMCPAFENGSVRIPDKNAEAKRKCRELIEEFVFWPLGQSDDLVMAFWFAWRLLERMKKSVRTTPVEQRVVPPYMRRGDEWNFPAQWSKTQQQAFLYGRRDDEDEEVVNA